MAVIFSSGTMLPDISDSINERTLTHQQQNKITFSVEVAMNKLGNWLMIGLLRAMCQYNSGLFSPTTDVFQWQLIDTLSTQGKHGECLCCR